MRYAIAPYVLIVDLDANGDVVGFDIDHASRKLDLSKIETIASTGQRCRVSGESCGD